MRGVVVGRPCQVADESVAIGDDLVKQATGVDRGQLVRVAEEDQLSLVETMDASSQHRPDSDTPTRD